MVLFPEIATEIIFKVPFITLGSWNSGTAQVLKTYETLRVYRSVS
jgi:hypothetical protein